jgi:hypothetical protein
MPELARAQAGSIAQRAPWSALRVVDATFHYARVVRSEILWRAMLGEGERDATAEEIAAIEAAHGPLLPPDGEG